MSIANTNITGLKINMPKLSQFFPNLAKSTLRAVAPNLAGKYIGPAFKKYDPDELIERLIVPVSDEDPDADAALEATDVCAAMLKDHDWLGLADYLIEFDRSRAAVPSGKRMIEVIMHFLRDTLSELYEAPNAYNFETSYVYSTDMLDAVEAAHLENPRNYMLAAIMARLHLDCAWSARGSKQIEELDGTTRSIIRDHSNLVNSVITDYDCIANNSPFLAEIQYSFAALRDPTLHRMMCAFDDWAELDPANITAYRHHAFFIHNLHGQDDDNIVSTEAQRAIELGHDVMGSGAYTVMYLHALQYDMGAYTHLDPTTFVNGFDDLMIALNRDPMRLIYLIEQLIELMPIDDEPPRADLPRGARAKSAIIRKALAPIIRKYLGVLYAAAWDLEEMAFLNAIAHCFQEELSNGSTVELTEGGVLITNPRTIT